MRYEWHDRDDDIKEFCTVCPLNLLNCPVLIVFRRFIDIGDCPRFKN